MIFEKFIMDYEKFGIPSTYPPYLGKACIDEFNYMIFLKNGSSFVFTSANIINSEWVNINLHNDYLIGKTNTIRGINIRVSEISIVVDGPLEG